MLLYNLLRIGVFLVISCMVLFMILERLDVDVETGQVSESFQDCMYFKYKFEAEKTECERKYFLQSQVIETLESKPSAYDSSVVNSTNCDNSVSVNNKDQFMLTQEMTSVLSKRDPSRDAVYFVETSNTGFIKPRFVCGIESAARAYSSGDVYVLIYNVTEERLNISRNENLHHVMSRYNNIHLLHIDMDKLFLNSPLQEFYLSNKLNSSEHYIVHLSDVIRILVIWTYGGKYFDLDVVIFKNLSQYQNFVLPDAPIEQTYLANGCFGMAKHSNVGTIYLKMLNTDWDPKDRIHNGPWMLTQAMLYYTGAGDHTGLATKSLKEFKYLSHLTFFPFNFYELPRYFDEEKSDEWMAMLNNRTDLWGVHISNSGSSLSPIRVGSRQPYSQLAQKYCPRAYWSCYDLF